MIEPREQITIDSGTGNSTRDILDIYVSIAENTMIFSKKEIEALTDIFESHRTNPGRDYIIIDERKGNVILGFAIFSRVEWTDHVWELYWIVIDKGYHGQGTGTRLLEKIESYILKSDASAILVAETSSAENYSAARLFYQKTGFCEGRQIPDYYKPGENLVTFYKKLLK